MGKGWIIPSTFEWVRKNQDQDLELKDLTPGFSLCTTSFSASCMFPRIPSKQLGFKKFQHTAWSYLYLKCWYFVHHKCFCINLNSLNIFICPGWHGSMDWVLACKLKGRWFDSPSGHMPGLRARSPVEGVREGNHTLMFLSFSLSYPPPLSKNK